MKMYINMLKHFSKWSSGKLYHHSYKMCEVAIGATSTLNSS